MAKLQGNDVVSDLDDSIAEIRRFPANPMAAKKNPRSGRGFGRATVRTRVQSWLPTRGSHQKVQFARLVSLTCTLK